VIEMQEHLQHPSEETLERFVMHQMREEELDTVEAHILACDDCVSRLEFLETQVAATRVALAELHQEKVAKSYAREKKSSWNWLKVSGYSLAGVAAAAVLTVSNLPGFQTVERDLSAFRGSETIQLPANHPLFLHLDGKDLAAAPVAIEVVTAEGSEVWKGQGVVSHHKVDAHLPKLTEKGNYLLRLYAENQQNTPGELVKEFALQVN
jgi:hypothetical protein